jgi:hypothetical protein
MKYTYLDIINAFIFSTRTFRLALIALASAVLIACGGGGGGGGGSSDSATSAPVSTQPDAEDSEAREIIEDAETSMDIQVPQGFMFSDYQDITFNISASSSDGNPITDTAISVYKVPSGITEWQDDYMTDAELILKGRLDDMGEYSKTLEVPGDVAKVLVRLAYIGMENYQLVDVENGMVNYSF